MKKIIYFLLALCMIMLCCCSKKEISDNENVKGDSGDITENVPGNDEQTDLEKNENSETEKAETNREEQNIPSCVEDVDAVIEKLGAVKGNGGEFLADADVFSKYLQMRQFDSVALRTGGKEEYYDFLSDVEIESYKIYPIEFTNEVIESKAEEGFYLAGEDMYLAEYNVTKGDGEYFKDGKNIYLMIFGYDAIAPGVLRAFVPYEQAEEYLYYNVNKYSDYDSYFIREFTALYGNYLSDGKNHPDSFDFNDSVHLITHLMARSGKYNEMPPYTLDEIEEFIKDSFDGNKGLEFNDARDYEKWMSFYPLPEDETGEGRLYGCAYAHGGTTAEYSVVSEEWENKYTKTVTVQLYSDYSKFAKAKQLVLTFEIIEDELPKLVLVMQNNNTGHETAIVSV